MTDTLRLSVVKAIQKKLKEIKTPAYEVDVGERVFLGRLIIGEETDTPAITLWEPFSEEGTTLKSQAGSVPRPGATQNPKDAYVVRYYIQGYAARPSNNNGNDTEPAYHLLGAIQKCLAASMGETKPFGSTTLAMNHGIIRPAGSMDSQHPFCLITLDITLTETRGNPYV